jgi:hypothetical protein
VSDRLSAGTLSASSTSASVADSLGLVTPRGSSGSLWAESVGADGEKGVVEVLGVEDGLTGEAGVVRRMNNSEDPVDREVESKKSVELPVEGAVGALV